MFFQSFARPNLRQWPARVSQGETPVPERSSRNGGSFQGPAASVGAPLGSFLNGIAPPSRGLRDRAVGGRCSGSGLLPLSVSGFEHQQEVAGAGGPTHSSRISPCGYQAAPTDGHRKREPPGVRRPQTGSVPSSRSVFHLLSFWASRLNPL